MCSNSTYGFHQEPIIKALMSKGRHHIPVSCFTKLRDNIHWNMPRKSTTDYQLRDSWRFLKGLAKRPACVHLIPIYDRSKTFVMPDHLNSICFLRQTWSNLVYAFNECNILMLVPFKGNIKALWWSRLRIDAVNPISVKRKRATIVRERHYIT